MILTSRKFCLHVAGEKKHLKICIIKPGVLLLLSGKVSDSRDTGLCYTFFLNNFIL